MQLCSAPPPPQRERVCSLMHLAPIHGDAAMVKTLSDNGCESNLESSLHHFFPLHIAAMTRPFPAAGAKPDIKVPLQLQPRISPLSLICIRRKATRLSPPS